MKLDKNYKMSKPIKCWLDQTIDPSERGLWKRAFTEAENHSLTARKKMLVKVVEQEGED